MTKRRTQIVLALAVLAAALVLAGTRPPLEPQFDGRSLSFWIEQQQAGELRKERAATEALQAIGSNAVPFLVRTLTARESRMTPRLRDFARRLGWSQGNGTPLRERQRLAAKACEAIGPPARAAMPALKNLLSVPELTSAVASALARMGPEGVLCLASAEHHTNASVRLYANWARGLAQESRRRSTER